MPATSPSYVKSDLPMGRSGEWSIEKFSLRAPQRKDTRPACFQSPSGTYTRLKEGNEVFMTDLYDEWWTQRTAMKQATIRGGNVLISGLGLGLVIRSILESPGSRVECVHVIERSSDVICLVAPSLKKRYRKRLKIIKADAFEWLPQPGQRFSVGWHDIWPNPHEPGLSVQTAQLERRYAPYCDWQGNWVRDYLAAEQESGYV